MIAPHLAAGLLFPRSEIAILVSRLQSACAGAGFFGCLCDKTHSLFLADARFLVEASSVSCSLTKAAMSLCSLCSLL
jgi:hypothetical protein